MPTSLPYRCPTCKSGLNNPRNLAVLIDGTSNKPGPKKTNVKKLYDVISDEEDPDLQVEQRKLYLEGIGAYGERFDMAFACNVEKNVEEAYKWLVERYMEGDQIYLFGFSRGAYQVRALAGIIHEVGLLRYEKKDRIEQAYHNYISIDPRDPRTREAAITFKKDFCWKAVRVHFIGVWDTVSSLGLIKRDVHITASASVTNACHFRHALALDERRVKFVPEYFSEINAHRVQVQGPRPVVGDVQEVWFAGCHSDVGGTSRPARTAGIPNLLDEEHIPVHAGNVPLLWVGREAAAKSLYVKLDDLTWYPEDVVCGRRDTMKFWWKLLEYLPIRHQVSFSGTGKHKQRWHLSRTRLVIPGQQIHFSVLSGDGYKPRATLGDRVDIPTVPRRASDGLWTTDALDEGATTRLLTLLLTDQRKTLGSLGRVLYLLDSWLDNGQAQGIPIPQWLGGSEEQSDFEKFVFAVIYETISNTSTSDSEHSVLVESAMNSLKVILSSRDQPYPPGFFHFVRFAARHEKLRRRLIAHDDVIEALVIALEQTAKSSRDDLFPLVVDSLCCLIGDDRKRNYVIDQLTVSPGGTETRPARLSLALEMKAPSHLIASLKLIATLAQHSWSIDATGPHARLTSEILQLAKGAKGPVGSAAVKALVALKNPLPPDTHFPNILGYLGDILPRLDAEVHGASSPDVIAAPPPLSQVNRVGSTALPDEMVPLPSVFQINDSGELDEKDAIMCKLLQAITSRHARERAVATLTVLKLCKNPTILAFCSKSSSNVMDIFMKQLERKETSLLAAYALNMCLKLNMWKRSDFDRAAQPIVTMFDKGWFDDAVGRVEGFKIFGELMTFGDLTLREKVIACRIVPTLMKKLESGEHHEVRMGSICFDVLGRGGQVELSNIVTESLDHLKNKDKKIQKKGVRILSALAQTEGGEQAIKPRVIDVVRLLLPPSERSPVPRSQLFGATAALYDLCRNETLREKIKSSDEFHEFMHLRHDRALYPQT